MSTGWVFWVNGAHLVLVTTECTRSWDLIRPTRLTSGLALGLHGRWMEGILGDAPGASAGGVGRGGVGGLFFDGHV